jgi:hypothetical protein
MRFRRVCVVAAALVAVLWAGTAAAADFTGAWAGQSNRGKPVAMTVNQVGAEFVVVMPVERRGAVRSFRFSFVANGLEQEVQGPNPAQTYSLVASFQGEDLVMTAVLHHDGFQAKAVEAVWTMTGPNSMTISMGPAGGAQGAIRTLEFSRQ